MKNNLYKLALIAMIIPLVGCGSKKPVDPVPPTPEPPAPEPEDERVDVEFNGYYKDGYSIKMPYSDEYFVSGQGTVLNKQLAMQSFSLALVGDVYFKDDNKEDFSEADHFLRTYYERTGFGNVYISEDYNAKPTTDSIGYGIASKSLSNGETLVAVSIRGGYYGAEWGSNVTLGEKGNHNGFSLSASIVYGDIYSYVEENNFDTSKLKIWISGYSRAGAVAELVGLNVNYINQKSEMGWEGFDVDDLFVYTFEAPQCVDKSSEKVNSLDVRNIINIVNYNDFIPMVPPTCYGLTNYGQTIDISEGVTDEIFYEELKKINDTLEPAQFNGTNPKNPDETLTPHQFWDYIINEFLPFKLTPEQEAEGKYIDLDTRAKYVQYIQPHARYFISLIMSLTSEQLDAVGKYFNDNLLSALSILTQDKDSLNDFVVKAFEAAGFTAYDAVELKTACDGLQLVIYSLYSTNELSLGVCMIMFSDVNYLIHQHCQEGILAYMNLYLSAK